MDIIRGTNNVIIDFLGGYQRPKDDIKYRLCKYVFEFDYDDSKILFNTLNGGICALHKYEYETMFNYKNCFHGLWLYEHFFIVPEEFDEDYVIDEYRNKNLKLVTPNYLNSVSTFTIFSTLKCNARCFYCYELGMKNKKNMSMETAEKVVDYIISSTCENQTVSLDWFGGEPLVNQDVIDYIVTMVRAAGRNVFSSMISNGYLFDDKIVSHAKSYWNLTSVQITLDGTEKQYNKTKSFIYKDGPSPFKKVIGNIHRLIRSGIQVTIRLNVDNNNADNIEELLYFLFKEFEGDRKKGLPITIYCFQIFEIGFERTPEQVDELSNKLITFNHLIHDNNFGFFDNDVHNGIKTNHCMIDSNDCVTIDPEGRVGVCEHHFDKHLFSNVHTPEQRNFDEIKYWQTKMEYTEHCADCKLKPICLKVPDCPSHRMCRGDEKKYWYDKISLGLITMYHNYLKNMNNNQCNCDDGNCGDGVCCNANDNIVKCRCNCESNF